MNCKHSDRERMAYFRFDVIAPLLTQEKGVTLRRRLEDRARTYFELPDGRRRRFSWMTIEDWLYRYKRGSLEALRDYSRQDRGCFRTMPPELCREIDGILEVAPRLKCANIIAELRNRDLLRPPHPSRSTLYRYIGSVRSEHAIGVNEPQERRSFEAHYSNQMWQADIMYGPKIPRKTCDGRWRKEKTYLIAILDDYSRLIVHAQFSFSQDLPAWFDVLKTACCKRGIPGKLYCDNGLVFRSDQIRRICAQMGTQLTYTQVRDAAAKGKIERFFNRLRSQFLEPQMLLHKPDRLHKLNEAFRKWLEVDYHRSPHRGIENQKPNDRWLTMSNNVRRISDQKLESEIFLFHTRRRVTRTATLSLNATTYETSAALAGKKVDIYYDPSSDAPPSVCFEGRFHGKATLLDRKANQSRRRKPKDQQGEQS